MPKGSILLKDSPLNATQEMLEHIAPVVRPFIAEICKNLKPKVSRVYGLRMLRNYEETTVRFWLAILKKYNEVKDMNDELMEEVELSKTA